MWFAMRNRCCTRSWTQKPQAGSSLGGGRVLVVVVGAGVVVEAPGVVVVVMVVDVVLVLLVVGGGAVVVVVVATIGQRLRSCGSTTMSGTGGLSTPSRLTVSVSSSPTLSTTVLVPDRRQFPSARV